MLFERTSLLRYWSIGSFGCVFLSNPLIKSTCSFKVLFYVSSLALLSWSWELVFLKYSTYCSRFSNAFFFLPLTRVALSLFCIFLNKSKTTFSFFCILMDCLRIGMSSHFSIMAHNVCEWFLFCIQCLPFDPCLLRWFLFHRCDYCDYCPQSRLKRSRWHPYFDKIYNSKYAKLYFSTFLTGKNWNSLRNLFNYLIIFDADQIISVLIFKNKSALS